MYKYSLTAVHFSDINPEFVVKTSISFSYTYIYMYMHIHFGEGNGNPVQCSCLENPRDREAWWAAVSGVAQNQTRLKRLSSSSSSIYILLFSHSGMSDCDPMD